jgi:hypothetical protein
MGQYHKLINTTKKEFVSGWDIGMMQKHYEQIGFRGSMADVLYCLVISQGNEKRGGGDTDGHDFIGHWTGDDIAVVGDYYTESSDYYKYRDLYDKVEEDENYTNISSSIRSMLEAVYPELTFKKEWFVTINEKGEQEDTFVWERTWKKEKVA